MRTMAEEVRPPQTIVLKTDLPEVEFTKDGIAALYKEPKALQLQPKPQNVQVPSCPLEKGSFQHASTQHKGRAVTQTNFNCVR